jgi:DNA repair protein RecO (recombination protein O)
MDYKYNAIILSKTDTAEADRIYILYTLEAGKVRALGKGVKLPKSKLAGNLEPISKAEIFIARTKGIGKITGVIPVDNFKNIKTAEDIIEPVFFALNILGKIIHDQEKDETIFRLLENFLEAENELGEKNNQAIIAPLLAYGFVFKVLAALGYGLDFEKCVGCGKKPEPVGNFFSPASGGLICRSCQKISPKKISISSDAIKIIRIFSKNSLKSLVKLKVLEKNLEELRFILEKFIQWTV